MFICKLLFCSTLVIPCFYTISLSIAVTFNNSFIYHVPRAQRLFQFLFSILIPILLPFLFLAMTQRELREFRALDTFG